MAAKTSSESVNRFVANARRLIIIQIIVALIALAAAALATWQISQALRQTADAKAQQAVAQAQQDQAARDTQKLAIITQQIRPALYASTREEFETAAQTLQPEAQQQQNEILFAMLAAAHYRAAQPQANAPAPTAEERETLQARLVDAAAALVEAIRLNQAKVEAFADVSSDVTHDEQLYVELFAMNCALLENETDDLAAKLSEGMAAIETPAPVAERLSDPYFVDSNALFRRECTGDLLDTVASMLDWGEMTEDYQLAEIEPVLSDEEAEAAEVPSGSVALPPPAPSEPNIKQIAQMPRFPTKQIVSYDISRVYMHVPSEAERKLSQTISRTVSGETGLDFPGTERVVTAKGAYKASVRYYHAEQRQQAENIQMRVAKAAQYAGADWNIDDIPLIQLRLPNLPRDRIEVWLPQEATPMRRKVSGIKSLPERDNRIDTLQVAYYKRAGDGLSASTVALRLMAPGTWSVKNPQISGERVNMLACHPDLSGRALEDFKTVAIALLDNGVPLNRIASFRDPTSKASNDVQLLYSQKGSGASVLTPEQIEAMSACPSLDDPLQK